MDFCQEDWPLAVGHDVDEVRVVIAPVERHHTSLKNASRFPPTRTKQTISFLELAPEIRNHIYQLVLAKPTSTLVDLDSDWKQPAISLTCHQVQAEVLSLWLGYYKWNFWPNRHGKQFSLSPLMKRWMARAGTDAAKIRQLQINARMPDNSRFFWEIRIDRDIETTSILRRVSTKEKVQEMLARSKGVYRSDENTNSVSSQRDMSFHSTVKPRNSNIEAAIAKEIGLLMHTMLGQNDTGFIGMAELEAVLEVLRQNDIKVPDSLEAQNPCWIISETAHKKPLIENDCALLDTSVPKTKPRAEPRSRPRLTVQKPKVQGNRLGNVFRSGHPRKVYKLSRMTARSPPYREQSLKITSKELCERMAKLSIDMFSNIEREHGKWPINPAM